MEIKVSGLPEKYVVIKEAGYYYLELRSNIGHPIGYSAKSIETLLKINKNYIEE